MHFCAIMASCLALKVLYVMLTISLHIRKPSPFEMTVRELKMTDRNSDKQLIVKQQILLCCLQSLGLSQ